MIKLILPLIFLIVSVSSSSEIVERYMNNQTMTHKEAIDHYKSLISKYEECQLYQYGKTDSGEPLHLFVISKDGNFSPDSIRKVGKTIVLINNAIHPGEPCGVDASAQLAEDLLSGKIEHSNVVVCIIPGYNIGGMLNRGCCSRANQNGPEQYGFRGNAKNLDLNRDFIKADAENTKQFYNIFHEWQPHIFIDAHSTNGADYPAEMTLINSARSRVEQSMRSYFTDNVTNSLYSKMIEDGFSVSPYFYTYGDTISKGLKEYMDSPRYSTGYTTLYNTMGFVSEAHMLKPYPTRVKATYAFLKNTVEYAQNHSEEIKITTETADKMAQLTKKYGINYQLDTTTSLEVELEVYRKKYKTSTVTGLPIHYYDTNVRDTLTIPYYATYKPTKWVDVPAYYIVPQQWSDVIERLDLNRIEYQLIATDTVMELETYYIKDYETIKSPYEGHYLHYNTNAIKDTQLVNVRTGDLLIPTKQRGIRYLLETLEPEATDSFFAWGFFDSILQQKEWFSDYVFEEKAVKLLENNPKLKEEFEQMKRDDKEFASNSWAMLYFLYKHSDNYEPTHNRHPIYRIPK
jgi:hypothetical protein